MDYSQYTLPSSGEETPQPALFTIPTYNKNSLYTATQAVLQLINDLTEAPREIGVQYHAAIINELETNLIEAIKDNDSLMELYRDIGMAHACVEQAACMHGFVEGQRLALIDGAKGAFRTSNNIDVDEFPYPDAPVELMTQLKGLLTLEALDLMEIIQANMVGEVQSVYAACIRAGYRLGSSAFDQLYLETQLITPKWRGGVQNGAE